MPAKLSEEGQDFIN